LYVCNEKGSIREGRVYPEVEKLKLNEKTLKWMYEGSGGAYKVNGDPPPYAGYISRYSHADGKGRINGQVITDPDVCARFQEAYLSSPRCPLETAMAQVAERAEALNPVGEPTPNFCFAAGTLVHTKQGLVPIEQIQVGDWVLSKHESGEGERAYKRVLRTIKSDQEEPIIYVDYYSEIDLQRYGSDALKRYGLFVTPGHPFYIKNAGWYPAIKVINPDELVSHDDTPVSAFDAFTLW
jgi:hypothetical protein